MTTETKKKHFLLNLNSVKSFSGVYKVPYPPPRGERESHVCGEEYNVEKGKAELSNILFHISIILRLLEGISSGEVGTEILEKDQDLEKMGVGKNIKM